MIARLKGLVDSVDEDFAVIDVGGVGYLVHASARTLRRLGAAGTGVALEIETRIREDAFELFGFIDRGERDWFRLLTTVQGVGARVGLAILSVIEPGQLTAVIASKDQKTLTAADGVGPKLAARIVNELSGKVGSLSLGGTGGVTVADVSPAKGGAATDAAAAAGRVAEDAVSALVNLGYKRAEAFTAVMAVRGRLGEGVSLDALIPAALRELSTQ
ncbi:Holliday junction branch migration protein RuvA [Radicibacter daui]|uniref:Holliday junction branch migration protein RuvA n=1 Tax=Radicibacter daui TaxID=3064829 RepID=UPI004046DCBB